ncbi:hypothetical protein PpBr36_00262 [Pyricularia pennisetigena]|uniref:hypothetical protein n=1 Tax=Pyricularia pennisetigena TaxID=1578925 RepID=UPI0011516F8D|nr:hypothetical protein PpBr36_00262 [Pyricularia pennisetigena]TLS28580.1 hypothetical protein PpBr36_00262 [Pyricularia pennisetigena]
MTLHPISTRFPPMGGSARCATPHTPEPMDQGTDHQSRTPSAPRPRLRLKRRMVPQALTAPTQDFLASVNAADTPIPSIEEPDVVPNDVEISDGIDLMASLARPYAQDRNLLSISCYDDFPQPKTPAPADIPSLPPRRYPDWSAGSSFGSSTEDDDDDNSSTEPDYESSRPSTSRSTYTNTSVFSRMSHFSDDQCMSPEGDLPKAAHHDYDDLPLARNAVGNGQTIRPKRHRAPWTKEMDAHLWTTFMTYLQDPRVTPFRTGRSCVPPHGVCTRVAREAKRSWRGSKAIKKVDNSTAAASRLQSGSVTPTANHTAAYIEWPHTCAATRTHFRDLCKLQLATPAHPSFRYLSRSPTPLTHTAARHWNRRSTPARSSFATKDMGLSLAVSTSEIMQPYGPLAQLTSSVEAPEPTPTEPDPAVLDSLTQDSQSLRSMYPDISEPPRGKLGSPFTPKSYGPSSSFVLLSEAMGAESSHQPHTVGPRRTLQSPPRMSRTSVARRRTIIGNKPPRDLRHSRKRGSLGNDFWTEPSRSNGASTAQDNVLPACRVRGKSFLEAALARFRPTGTAAAEYSSTKSNNRDELFIPRYTGSLGSPLRAESEKRAARLPPSTTAPELLRIAATEAPPRLGSPFSLAPNATSLSFPNRLFAASSANDTPHRARDRLFKTVQQPSSQAVQAAREPPTESYVRLTGATGATRERGGADSLSQRLAYVDDPLINRLLLWTCPAECDYTCQHIITSDRIESGQPVVQFHGKWPFYRVLGMQEPFSVIFSAGNLYAHLLGYRWLRRYIPESYPLRKYYIGFSFAGIASWLFSIIFHTRDTNATEQLDYFAAGASVLYGLYLAVIRIFRLDRPGSADGGKTPTSSSASSSSSPSAGSTPRAIRLWTAACLTAYGCHVAYLKLVRWDYGYNMAANVCVGLAQNVLWSAFSYRKYTREGRTWATYPGLAVAWIMLAMSLELFDFPPLWGALDAHALWHLGTIAPAVLWYSFLVKDAQDDMAAAERFKD